MQMPETIGLKSKEARKMITSWIQGGKFKPGQRIPSERELSSELNMATKTVRQALAEMVKDGLICKRARVGNFVTDRRPLKRVAMIFPSVMFNHAYENPAVSFYMRGVDQVMAKDDYIVYPMSYDSGRCWLDAGQAALAGKVQGALLFPYKDITRDILEKYINAGIKIVCMGYHPDAIDLGIPSVEIDTTIALKQMLQKFIELGHRRIKFVLYGDSFGTGQERAILEYLCQKNGLGKASDVVVNVTGEVAIGREKSEELESLFDGKNRPTAIAVADEFIASKIFRLAFSKGLRIPQDVSFAARWDNTPAIHPVPLSAPDSMELAKQSAAVACELLAKMLEGSKMLDLQIKLRSRILWKESVGVVPR